MGLIGKILFWIGWPLSFVFGRGQRTRVLVTDGARILLVKDLISADDAWGLPGGGLHRGEPVERGAVREVREETVVLIDTPRLLATEPRNNHGLRFKCSYLLADTFTRTTGRRSLEIRASHWFTLGELKKMAVKPDVRRALELAGLL